MGPLANEASLLLEELSRRLGSAIVAGRPLARIARVRDLALRRWSRRLARNL